MGMFAEPVTQSIQTESWAVNLVRQSDTLLIPTRSLGFSEHGFIYLARNAYYQNQSDKLLLAIEKVCKDGHWLHGPNNKLEFIRIENGRSEVVATLSLDTAK